MRMSAMIRQSFKAMTPQERFWVIGMYGLILLLHAIGFFVFIVFVVPAHYKDLGIGVSVVPRMAVRTPHVLLAALLRPGPGDVYKLPAASGRRPRSPPARHRSRYDRWMRAVPPPG